jgi:hypothetical protein
MTPNMPDWFRSAAVLGAAFVTVAVVTIGLAALIVPNPAVSAQGSQPPAAGGGPGPSGDPSTVTAVGGTLAVSGDREASFTLDRESVRDRYALEGEDGRIIFEGEPLSVGQISYDGLEFFLDPTDCTVTPGERHDPTGVAGAHVRCEEIADVRDNGVITLDGTVGIAADLLGLRGDLPESGGTVAVGDESFTFGFAAMTIPSGANIPTGIYAGTLFDPESEAVISFSYDPQTHAMVLSEIAYAGDVVQVPAGACSVNAEEIGLLNPHTRVADMTVYCAAVDVPSPGTVPVDGSLVVELSEPPG